MITATRDVGMPWSVFAFSLAVRYPSNGAGASATSEGGDFLGATRSWLTRIVVVDAPVAQSLILVEYGGGASWTTAFTLTVPAAARPEWYWQRGLLLPGNFRLTMSANDFGLIVQHGRIT